MYVAASISSSLAKRFYDCACLLGSLSLSVYIYKHLHTDRDKLSSTWGPQGDVLLKSWIFFVLLYNSLWVTHPVSKSQNEKHKSN